MSVFGDKSLYSETYIYNEIIARYTIRFFRPPDVTEAIYIVTIN